LNTAQIFVYYYIMIVAVATIMV